LICIVSSRYLAATSEQAEDVMGAVVRVSCSVCKSVRLLQLFVVTSYKSSVNPIIESDPVPSHQ
jgi:hypothetical protein